MSPEQVMLNRYRDYLLDLYARARLRVTEDLPREIYEYLVAVNPLRALLVVAAVAFLPYFLRRYGKRSLIWAINIVLLSLLVLPSGRAVLGAASELPPEKKPTCILGAVLERAVWSLDRLSNVPVCFSPEAIPNLRPTWTIDRADDGLLEGRIDGPGWTAKVQLPTNYRRWVARTNDIGGVRLVYIDTAEEGRVYRVAACPDDRGSVPKSVIADRSGRQYVAYIGRYARPESLGAIVAGATEMNRFAGSSGAWSIANRRGGAIAFLLPAAGERGHCALLTGPYRFEPDGGYDVAPRTSSSERILAIIARDMRITGLTVR